MSKSLTTQAVLGTARKLGLTLQSSAGPERAHKNAGLAVRKFGRTIGVIVGSDSNIADLCTLARELLTQGRTVYHPLLKRTVCADEINLETFSNGAFRSA